jgi:hypothetical protein
MFCHSAVLSISNWCVQFNNSLSSVYNQKEMYVLVHTLIDLAGGGSIFLHSCFLEVSDTSCGLYAVELSSSIGTADLCVLACSEICSLSFLFLGLFQ